jgi:phosphatidylserine/phosphatidylglycerophosphate/cardiolipin synthase-like enzyme
MHLKRYQIDGRTLRTGAANFSASGLKRQDNDLVVVESAAAAA